MLIDRLGVGGVGGEVDRASAVAGAALTVPAVTPMAAISSAEVAANFLTNM